MIAARNRLIRPSFNSRKKIRGRTDYFIIVGLPIRAHEPGAILTTAGQMTGDGREHTRWQKSPSGSPRDGLCWLDSADSSVERWAHSCSLGRMLSEGISATRRCLSTCTPSWNMSTVAIRITTTARIDNTETYSKNALALPTSNTPQKAKLADRI